jgi:hypothetical protein
MSTFLLILFGIILGWLIPRPWVIRDVEERFIGPIKQKIPVKYRWWLP